MTTSLAWAAAAIGLGGVIAKRQRMTVLVLIAQTILIAMDASMLANGRSGSFLLAAIILWIRVAVLAILLNLVMRTTREDWHRRTEYSPLTRIAVTAAALILFNLLLPPLGFLTPPLQSACLVVVTAGLGMVLLRHGTLFQLVGILIAENGLSLIAISVTGGVPLLIELGAAFDLLVVLSVGLLFHSRIAKVFQSTNSTLLRELHD